MSQKKRKKRHPQNKRASAAAMAESEFSSDGKRKRMNRTSRNILLFTLVLLALSQILTQNQLISDAVSNAFALIGLILLLIALWFQFRNPTGGSQSGVKTPRLR